MDREKLVKIAKKVEPLVWCPEGGEIDGCPYGAGKKSWELMDEAMSQYEGGLDTLKGMVEERKATEPLANFNCANWILWTLLNDLGVSRVTV